MKIQTKKQTGRKKTGQHTKTEQEELKDIHSNHGSCGKNIKRAYTEKKNCQAARGLSTYAPAGKQRPWRITRPTRVGATPSKRIALQLRVGCPALPTQGQDCQEKWRALEGTQDLKALKAP